MADRRRVGRSRTTTESVSERAVSRPCDDGEELRRRRPRPVLSLGDAIGLHPRASVRRPRLGSREFVPLRAIEGPRGRCPRASSVSGESRACRLQYRSGSWNKRAREASGPRASRRRRPARALRGMAQQDPPSCLFPQVETVPDPALETRATSSHESALIFARSDSSFHGEGFPAHVRSGDVLRVGRRQACHAGNLHASGPCRESQTWRAARHKHPSCRFVTSAIPKESEERALHYVISGRVVRTRVSNVHTGIRAALLLW
jgi:hypothetical protein